MSQPIEQQASRTRILEAAYDLFTRRRVRDVGINELIAHAGVSKATFYNQFESKDDLVVAFLELREQRATVDWLLAEAQGRGSTSQEQLLAIFDVFDEWFAKADYEACPFIHVLLEMGPDHVAGQASARHLENVRSILRKLAEQSGLRDPGAFARAFHILMKGAIVAAVEGDSAAAQLAQEMAKMLIAAHSTKTELALARST